MNLKEEAITTWQPFLLAQRLRPDVQQLLATHYSLLHTIESIWGLSPLTTAVRDAPVITECLST